MARSSTGAEGLAGGTTEVEDLAGSRGRFGGLFSCVEGRVPRRNTPSEGRYNALAPACVDLLIAVAPHDSGGFPGVGLGDLAWQSSLQADRSEKARRLRKSMQGLDLGR